MKPCRRPHDIGRLVHLELDAAGLTSLTAFAVSSVTGRFRVRHQAARSEHLAHLRTSHRFGVATATSKSDQPPGICNHVSNRRIPRRRLGRVRRRHSWRTRDFHGLRCVRNGTVPRTIDRLLRIHAKAEREVNRLVKFAFGTWRDADGILERIGFMPSTLPTLLVFCWHLCLCGASGLLALPGFVLILTDTSFHAARRAGNDPNRASSDVALMSLDFIFTMSKSVCASLADLSLFGVLERRDASAFFKRIEAGGDLVMSERLV